MKKVLVTASVACLVLSAAACIGKGKAPPPPPPPMAPIITKG